MEVADSILLGNWKVDKDATENFDGYAEAMKIPAEVAAKVKNEKQILVKVWRDGDTYNIASTMSDRCETISFQLGEKFKTREFGIEAENVFTVEGNMVVGEHSFMGQTAISRRYLKDGKQILESEGNGAIMKHVLVKC